MIKRIIKGIVLAVFFAGALLISNYVMNRGTDDKITLFTRIEGGSEKM